MMNESSLIAINNKGRIKAVNMGFFRAENRAHSGVEWWTGGSLQRCLRGTGASDSETKIKRKRLGIDRWRALWRSYLGQQING